MPFWYIRQSDISTELNRYGSYEQQEIEDIAEELGYTQIEENDGEITALDPDGREVIIAEED